MIQNLKPVRLGLIGAGRWARAYVKTIAAMPDVCIVRVARRSQGIPDFLPAGTDITTDWKAVACAKDLDAVIVVTPPSLHAEMAAAAIAAGLPVLIEKPLTLNLAEAQKLRDTASKHNGLVMVEHTHLFNPAFRELKRLAAGLGPIRAIASSAGNWGPFRKDVPILWDWGAHDVAMCLDIMRNAPIRISARRLESRAVPEGDGEVVSVTMEFPDRAEAQIRLSNILETKTRTFTAQFESCSLVYDDMGNNKLTRHASDEASGAAIACPSELPLGVAVREFCDAVRSGSTGRASLDLGVDVVKVLEQCSHDLR